FVGGHRTLCKAGRAACVKDRGEITLREVFDGMGIAIRKRLSGLKGASRSGVRDNILDFGCAKQRVDRNRYRTCQLNSKKSQTPIEPIAKLNRYAISLSNAKAF